MISIENITEIEAPIDRCWSVLIDFDAYAEWNPTILSIDGKAAHGGAARMRIKPGPHVLDIDIVFEHIRENEDLSWSGGNRLVRGFHYFRLAPGSNGGTQLIHGEKFAFWPSVLVWPILIFVVKRSYQKADIAFKLRCEAAKPV